MTRLSLAMLISVVGGAACVDPSSLAGFDCDDAGRCKPPSTAGTGGGSGGGATSTGGGTAATGGGATSGGGGGGEVGGGAGGGGGAALCSTSTCTGCCDDSGVCRSGNELSACGQGGNTCATCGAATRCFAAVCQPLAANGSTCASGAECTSGACVGSLCCSTACTGACETCSAAGNEGRCSPLAETTAPSLCGDFACDGVSGSCPTTCTTSRQCAPGRFCNSGTCVALKVTGTTCGSSAECQSGFCADGVCCNSACSGSCDRCNLSASNGTCSPAPASDPGSPACGGSVVCNGTLADCPILCTSGCPASTYCSGTYCSAKKSNGVTCGAATECSSNFCVDGVCCNQACGDSCDACSVAQGAAVNGTCGLLGPSRICRAATSTCDVEERCNGSAATCPGNGFADAGVGCGSVTFTAWSVCDGGSACASMGGQTRTRTEPLCNGVGSCTTVNSGEAQSCMRTTEGTSCGTTTFSAYTSCNYASSCATTGSRTRTRTDPLCASGTCSAVQNTETDTAGCVRTTDNLSCGASTYGAYSACTFGATCAETGSRTRTRTDPVCQTGTCGSTTATETDSTGCTRTTGGQSCGTTMTGAYGACSYGSTCATTGTRSRTVSTYTCGSGACNTSTVTENDTAGCNRTTSGSSCGTTQTTAYTACSYASACSNTGSRTRQVTTYACNGTGTCNPNTVTETDTVGCNRSQDGSSCGATSYGAYTACGYANGCSNSGSRTRSMTTYTCGGGACNTAGGTDTDTAGCARNMDGTSCGTTTYGTWSSCSYGSACTNSGSRTRPTTTYTCGGSVCNTGSGTDTDTASCARNTTGTICGPPSCGVCGGCNCDCERLQNCSGSRCTAEVCAPDSWTQVCSTSCPGCNLCIKSGGGSPEL